MRSSREPRLLKGLRSREACPYFARIRKNEVLNRISKPYLTHPAGRSQKALPRLWFHELTYQGGELGSGASGGAGGAGTTSGSCIRIISGC